MPIHCIHQRRTSPAGLAPVARVVIAALGLILAVESTADAAPFGRRFHQWGRFRPGSWVVVRQGCETVDRDGRVVANSVSETRSTLATADDHAVTLHVQASLEIGGKKIDGAPQTLREGLAGETSDASTYVDLGEESVVVQGRAYHCNVQQTESIVGGRKRIVKTWFAPHIAPYVLRKLTTTRNAETDEVVAETQMDVVSLSVERRILARLRPVAEVRIVERHDRGQTRARAYCCPEIPGGIVSQTAEEFDAEGKLLRRTNIELVDFETK
jgi:hypothetical protein